MKHSIYIIVLFLLLISCNTKRSVIGNYRSNFASGGFFITRIKLNSDSTAQYNCNGDMLHEKLNGKYIVYKKTLYFRIDKAKDTLSFNEKYELYEKDSTIFKNSHSYDLKTENGISYHFKYKIKPNKLLVYNIVTGKIVRKSNYYSDKMKFTFFGPKSYNKKYYLKKLD